MFLNAPDMDLRIKGGRNMVNKKSNTKAIGNSARVGVFLCTCGGKIGDKVDLKSLEKQIADNSMVTHVEMIPYPCLAPGLDVVKERVASKGLNRVVIAGCEYRVMLQKFEKELEKTGLEKGEADIVNLRDYVATVNNGDPSELAVKGAKLINAAVAGLFALTPSPKTKIDFNGPVMILGWDCDLFSSSGASP